MQLRPADPSDDLVSLQELEKAARTRYIDFPNLAFAMSSPPIALERLQAGELVVAEDGDGIAGFILTIPMDDGLYVANISVALGHSGRGIGAALIQDAIRRAEARQLYEVMLTTFRAPKWNGPWFRRFGFVPMLEDMIGPGLRAVLDRQGKFVDPATRETLWRGVGDECTEWTTP
jgi:GNAT superfamily N-acetyltransferase